MPSTYTQNLGLEKPATGEQAGVWGNTANTSYDSIDAATDGSLLISLSANAYNLSTANGGPCEGHNKVIQWGGPATATVTVNVQPNTAQKLFVMRNRTTGGFAINFQQGTGGIVTLQPGYDAVIFCDGAGANANVAVALDSPQFTNVLVNGTLQVGGAATFSQPQTFTQPVTFNGSVALNGPTAATQLTVNTSGYPAGIYDLYYRSVAGSLAPLAIGMPGQLLQVGSNNAPQWATVSMSIGGGVAGSIPNALYFSGPGNLFAQDARLAAYNGCLGIGVLPAHPLHILGASGQQSEIWLDTGAPQSQFREIVWATNNSPRWNLYSPNAAESGGNVGSDLSLANYSDTGVYLGTCLYFTRASGNLTIGAAGDLGARLGVAGGNPAQPAMLVRGAASQQYLQVWQNSAGTTVASIDSTGKLTLAASSFFQATLPSGRLDLYGSITGHPWGTIHVGHEPGTNTGAAGLIGSIAMEAAGPSTDAIPAGMIRFFYRNGYFAIQFTYGGATYFAVLPLTPYGQAPVMGNAQWVITTSVL